MRYQEWKAEGLKVLQGSDGYLGLDVFWLETELRTLVTDLLLPDLAETEAQRYLLQHEFSDDELARLRSATNELAAGKPMALVTGFTWFYGVKIRCYPDVLVPRPDSEIVVEEALAYLEREVAPCDVLDLCTGSGCLGLALAKAAGPSLVSRVVATDLSPTAVKAATENARLIGLEAVVTVEEADLWPFGVRDGSFVPKLVISNPPYLREDEFLGSDLGAWEPEMALAAGADGLAMYRRIFSEGAKLLGPGTYLLLEHGLEQAEAMRDLALGEAGWAFVKTSVDLAGRPRVSAFRRVEA